MFNRVIKSLGAIAVGCAFSIGTQAAAETVSIDSVTGSWLLTEPADVYGLNGLGTKKVSWGAPATSLGSKGQSAFQFDGLSASTSNIFDADETFALGTFTHFNHTLWATGPKTGNKPASITSAQLSVTIVADFGDGVKRSHDTVFDFTLWETANEASRCANGQNNHIGVNMNGCADRVTLTRNDKLSEYFTIGDKQYQFDIFGFDGKSEYWTIEKMTNSANLSAFFTLVGPTPGGEPSPVPLPAGGVLLLTALGGTVLAKRRRKA